jgi:hypothetical protein
MAYPRTKPLTDRQRIVDFLAGEPIKPVHV